MFRFVPKVEMLELAVTELDKKECSVVEGYGSGLSCREFRGLRNRIRIHSLVVDDGSFATDNIKNKIKKAIAEFYTSLLGKPHKEPNAGKVRAQNVTQKRLSTLQSGSLVAEVTEVDIKDVFWSLKTNKVLALGADGYSESFLNKSSEVVADYNFGLMLRKANATLIAWVSKIPTNPSV
ncbi:hypothetical protein U1Q18_014442 [Sarracenia purpurea var. burkii]